MPETSKPGSQGAGKTAVPLRQLQNMEGLVHRVLRDKPNSSSARSVFFKLLLSSIHPRSAFQGENMSDVSVPCLFHMIDQTWYTKGSDICLPQL